MEPQLRGGALIIHSFVDKRIVSTFGVLLQAACAQPAAPDGTTSPTSPIAGYTVTQLVAERQANPPRFARESTGTRVVFVGTVAARTGSGGLVFDGPEPGLADHSHCRAGLIA